MSETKNLKLFKHEEPLETNNNKFDIDKALNKNWDKVDDYAGEANSKIDLITEIIDLLPKVSNKGESITLENTARAKFTKFRTKGNSSQETRSGKNLINSFNNYSAGYTMTNNGVTFTLLEDGKIRVNGTAVGGRAAFTFVSKEIKLEAGNYVLSYGSSKVVVECKIENNYPKVAGYSKTISLTEESRLMHVALIVDKGITVDNEIVYAQLEEEKENGTVATEYEQYGTMPSVEFPSEIKNVKENVRINIRNKNFCDLDILEKLKEKAITINSSNSFTINLENGRMGITSRINIMLPDGIDKSKKYRIKYHRKMNNTSFLPRLFALYADGSNDGVEDRILEADYEYVTSGKELSGITLAWNTQNQGGIVTFSDISITEINENSDFEESKKQTIIFPFKQGQKLMQGDYLADDGIHHTKTQIQLDGVTAGLKVTNVTKNSNDIYYCVIKIIKQGINGINNMYCSHFTPYFKVKPGSCYITGSGGTIVLASTDQTITTVDAANTWLATQKEKGTPVVIEYELAEEEIETYTEVQKEAYEQIKNAISYKGQTNIFSTNEIKPIFEVEALADIGLLLNNMQAQILAGGE